MMARNIREMSAALLALALAGCGGNQPIVDGASCYPEAARKWITAPRDQANAVKDPGGPYSVYFDGSASMAGYIRGSSANERPLADLVAMLPDLDTIDRSKVEIVRFDRKVSVLARDQASRMQTEGGYICPADQRNCDAQESHIDQALARIAAADAKSLSVVVSDLWLANSEVMTTDGVALSKPLSDIFASGRSVAVYGFESPYRGRVNDLPSKNPNISANRRYLFLIVAGPVDRLEAFQSAMKTAPSASIARDLGSGKAQYSLFTLDPVQSVGAGTQSFALPPKSPFKKVTFLETRAGVRMPQYQLEKSLVLRAAQPEALPAPTWAGVSATAIRPGAVWQGKSQGAAKLFREVGNDCAPKGADWRDEGELRSGWQAASGGGFSLDPEELATLPSGRYLIVGGLRRVSLDTPNPATEWMRQWSFESATEAEAVKRLVMPTLNLAETARLLEVALLKSAQSNPMNIGGFAVAVEIK